MVLRMGVLYLVMEILGGGLELNTGFKVLNVLESNIFMLKVQFYE
jgi:hypothetical protein